MAFVPRKPIEAAAERLAELTYKNMMELANDLTMEVAAFEDDPEDAYDLTNKNDFAKLLSKWANGKEREYKQRVAAAEAAEKAPAK